MASFRVKEIWRYPVKSMRGERLDHIHLGKGGIPFDRGWAIRDEATKTIRGAKHIAGLLNCSARYLNGTSAGVVPHVSITLPDGVMVRSDEPDVDRRLSAALDRDVTLWPLQPTDNINHYKLTLETGNAESELRKTTGLLPDEPIADFSNFPRSVLREISRYASPRGTYFDAFPVNILTEASLRHLQILVPSSILDVRRFRPNFLISDDEDGAGLPEYDWIGHEVLLGQSRVNVVTAAPRCIMTTREQFDLPRDAQIMRALVRETKQCLSVYAEVASEGLVSVGAAVETPSDET